MGAQERNFAELIQNANKKKILLSSLGTDYQNRYGKKPVYPGKFKDYLERQFPDNIEIRGIGISTVVTWVGKNTEIDCGDGSKKKTKDEEKALRNYTNQEELLTEIIQKLAISSSTKIQLSNIIQDYQKHVRNESGQPPTYEGKFKNYIATSIPGVKAGSGSYIIYHAINSGSSEGPSEISYQENNNVAASLESSEAKANQKKKKEKEKKDEVKIAVHDSSADIITFSESIRGKSDSVISAKQEEEDDNAAVRGIEEGFEGLSLEERNAKANELATSLFLPKGVLDGIQKNKGLSLFKSSGIENQPEGALLGHLFDDNESSNEVGEGVYINTHSPFCFITVGVQGAGKSHTSSCILESCLVPFEPGNIVKLKVPQTTLVLHYDQNTTSICEAAGLLSPNPNIKAKMNQVGNTVGAMAIPKEKAVILVSPAFYLQRKKFYGDACTVKPLLFRWRSLTADHIKRIMRIESGDNQLYVASFLDLLRSYQKKAVVPDFADFLKQVRDVCSIGAQKGPLDQRINLLESIVAESEKNSGLVGESLDLVSSSKDGYHLIIADMTDPLLSKDEANGLFQVLTEQFRSLPTKGGKVLMLDEAHKYMMGEKSDGLSEAIVNAARLMRHDGLRLVVSTQSPKALAPELLELVTIAALHHFHSPDWFSYIKQKLPLGDDDFESILSLNSGEAVGFATTHDLYGPGICSFKMRIRPRITTDLGSSRRNS